MMHLSTSLSAPKVLSLLDDQYYADTFTFLKKIESYIINEYNLEISFSSCIEIEPSAALLLFSTVNFLHLKYGFNRIRIKQLALGSTLSYDAALSRSGVWEALNCKCIQDVENLVNQNNKFKTSCDQSILKKADEILKSIKDLSQEHIFFLNLAMKEAVLNVIYHAYINKAGVVSPDELGTRWWQCAWVNTKQKTVNIIIHDRGVGVLGSYKNGQDEEHALNEAFLQGFSRSGLVNRGMGSEDMKSPVNELMGQHTLTVLTGEFVYEYQLRTIQPIITKRKVAICGTLVHWNCSYGNV